MKHHVMIALFAAGSLAVVSGCEGDVASSPLAPTVAADEMSATLDVASAGISAPEAGEIIFENTLALAGSDGAAADNTVRWAVRFGTCDADASANVAGNVTGVDDDFEWADGDFSAVLDISEWDAGEYCFVLNTQQGDATGSRLTREFYVVDEYVKIGGTVDLERDGFDVRGGPWSHALDGVVGNAGAAGTVGSVTVNYRWFDTHCTFTPTSLTLTTASGIGVTADLRGDLTGAGAACDNGDETSGASLFAVDRDATDLFPRGAVIVRWTGGVSQSQWEIDSTPGATGADSWVEMVRGNNHVGVR